MNNTGLSGFLMTAARQLSASEKMSGSTLDNSSPTNRRNSQTELLHESLLEQLIKTLEHLTLNSFLFFIAITFINPSNNRKKY